MIIWKYFHICHFCVARTQSRKSGQTIDKLVGTLTLGVKRLLLNIYKCRRGLGNLNVYELFKNTPEGKWYENYEKQN